MKKLKSVFIMCFLLFICFEMLTDSKSILDSVSLALLIFKENIFPSLFPFLVLSSLLINYGFAEFMANIFGKIMYFLFKVNGECAFIFFMSIISGNPANAKCIREFYLDKKINKYEATKILCFCAFTSPLFILGSVSVLLNSKKAAFLILICHYLSNVITGLLLRNYHPSKKIIQSFSFKKAVLAMHNKRISNKESFGIILTNSLTSSINTLMLILGVITVCLVFTTIINNNLNLNSVFQSVLNGFIEMTQGLKYISKETLSLKFKSIFSIMLLSFGGFSIHLQIMSILSDTDIKYLPFLLSRVFCMIVAASLLYLSFDYFI